ncbi:MAG: hypothetical protein H7301_01310 [Cryobacterium sp.]|nr:hypothetical protein [Oligoflexia bacterium]
MVPILKLSRSPTCACLIPTVAFAMTLTLPSNALGAKTLDPVALCQNLLIESSVVSDAQARVGVIGRYLVEDFPIIQSAGFYREFLSLSESRLTLTQRYEDITTTDYLNLLEASLDSDAEVRNAATKKWRSKHRTNAPFRGKRVTFRDLDEWDEKTFEEFKKFELSQEDWLDHNQSWLAEYRAGSKTYWKERWPRRFEPFGTDVRADLKIASELLWDKISQILLGKNSAEQSRLFGVKPSELAALQPMIRTINAETPLRKATIDLIDSILIHSIPHLKNLTQMSEHNLIADATSGLGPVASAFASPIIGALSLIHPYTYCYIGDCAKVAFTGGKLQRQAYEKSVSPKPLESGKADEPPTVARLKSVSLSESANRFLALQAPLGTTPSLAPLKDPESLEIANYDRAPRRALHETAVLGLADHEVFTNRSIWSGFADFLERNPNAEKYGRVRFLETMSRYRVHVENYAQSLKYQLEGLRSGRENYERMQSTVQGEIAGEPEQSTLRYRELSGLEKRIREQIAEALQMENSVESWLERCHRIENGINRIAQTADPLRAAPLGTSEIKKIKSEILSELGIKVDKRWYRF